MIVVFGLLVVSYLGMGLSYASGMNLACQCAGGGSLARQEYAQALLGWPYYALPPPGSGGDRHTMVTTNYGIKGLVGDHGVYAPAVVGAQGGDGGLVHGDVVW
jgi:hypothetical protein